MKKSDLINAIAEQADLTKVDAGRALDAVQTEIFWEPSISHK